MTLVSILFVARLIKLLSISALEIGDPLTAGAYVASVETLVVSDVAIYCNPMFIRYIYYLGKSKEDAMYSPV
jgi:hypothetical protein